MNKTIRRLLSVTLILVLVLSLGACGKKDEDKGGSPADDIADITPADDPAAYLRAASGNTLSDLKARYSGSPMLALSALQCKSGSAAFSLSASQDGETVALGGDLGFDTDAGKLLLKASVDYMGENIDAGLYLDKDYLGLSVPMLLGSDTYYGFVPHDLYDQAAGSAIGKYLDDETLEAFKEIDALLDSFNSIDPAAMEESSKEIEKLCRDFADSVELTAKADGDGWIVEGMVTAEALADLLESVTNVALDSSSIGALSGMAASGEAADVEDLRSQLSETFRDMRASGGKLTVSYYIAGEKLVKVAITPEGENAPEGNSITVDLYDGDKVTFDVVSEGSDPVTLTSEVKSEKGSYKHTLTMTSDGQTMTVTADWTDNRLDLSMTMDGETLLSLTGDFGVSADGFYLTGGKLTGEGMDGEDLGLDIRYTDGGTVETPAELKNIFTMDDRELTELILSVVAQLDPDAIS